MKYACPRWLNNVKDQPKVLQEEKLYKAQFLPQLASQISSLFTLPDGTQANVTTKDVENIYSLCGYEVSFYDQDQTWCSLLKGQTEEETVLNFNQLEITSDLDDFYTHGPGVPFNKHLGCQLGTAIQESIELALATDASSFQEAMKAVMKKKHGGDGGTGGAGAGAAGGGDDDEDPVNNYKFILKFGHSETIFFFSDFLVSSPLWAYSYAQQESCVFFVLGSLN